MAIRGVFVTGTDTGVGKTEVSCAIARALVARGFVVDVYKPAETGCTKRDAALVGEDCERLAAAAGGRQSAAEVASYLFELPAAPLVAAEAEGSAIDRARLREDFEHIAAESDFVLVEGAGGLLVPIDDGLTYADLADNFGLPVLLVVGSRLGCINHALLTLEVLQARHIPIAGFVVNCLADGQAALDEARMHERTIARFTEVASLGVFAFLPEGTSAAAAETHLDLDALL
jgi:dethiobiotin synthetase